MFTCDELEKLTPSGSRNRKDLVFLGSLFGTNMLLRFTDHVGVECVCVCAQWMHYQEPWIGDRTHVGDMTHMTNDGTTRSHR